MHVCVRACLCACVCVCVCVCVSARQAPSGCGAKNKPERKGAPPPPSPRRHRRAVKLAAPDSSGRWRRVLPRASASWGEGVRIGSGVVSLGLWHPRVLVPKWTYSTSAPLHPCLSGRVEESPREMLSGGGVLPQSLLV